MSFVIRYHRLFKVTIQAEGSDLTLPGFSSLPTAATRSRLADHQLIFRAWENGFGVFYQTNPLVSDSLLGRIGSRKRFSFGLFLSDVGFFDRYEPDLTPDNGPQLYLDNLTAVGAIQPAAKQTLTVSDVVQSGDAMILCPAVFLVSTDLSGAGPQPTKYVVRDKFDPTSVILEVPINAGAGGDRVVTKVDMSAHASGPYTLMADPGGAVAKTIYIDNDLAGARMLGMIDIYWETAQDTAPADGLSYRIEFRKR